MDNLDRMYRHLVRTIRARFPQYLTQSFDVGELYQTILPYRLHRRELGLETNDDYEITLTRLLAGERDFLVVDDRMRDALRAQLASANPDPGAFKQFASTSVALSPAALMSLDAGPTTEDTVIMTPASARPAPRASAAPAAPAAAPAQRASGEGATSLAQPGMTAAAAAAPVRPSTPGAQSVVRPSGSIPVMGMGTITPAPGEHCRSCDEVLPAGRAITFCPHCGQNLTTLNCPACGAELELGWKFCPTCGRPSGVSTSR